MSNKQQTIAQQRIVRKPQACQQRYMPSLQEDAGRRGRPGSGVTRSGVGDRKRAHPAREKAGVLTVTAWGKAIS